MEIYMKQLYAQAEEHAWMGWQREVDCPTFPLGCLGRWHQTWPLEGSKFS